MYCKYRIPIKEGRGLYYTLIEGDKIVNEVVPQSCEESRKMAEAYHCILALWDDLQFCDTARWNTENHLKQITTGSVNYGIPSNPSNDKERFYKDFEYE